MLELEVTASEQFSRDYLLVVDNDQSSHTYILTSDEYKAKSISGLSDLLRADWDEFVCGVIERERENGNKVGSLLLAQMLLNWGTPAFDKIARYYIEGGE